MARGLRPPAESRRRSRHSTLPCTGGRRDRSLFNKTRRRAIRTAPGWGSLRPVSPLWPVPASQPAYSLWPPGIRRWRRDSAAAGASCTSKDRSSRVAECVSRSRHGRWSKAAIASTLADDRTARKLQFPGQFAHKGTMRDRPKLSTTRQVAKSVPQICGKLPDKHVIALQDDQFLSFRRVVENYRRNLGHRRLTPLCPLSNSWGAPAIAPANLPI